MLILHQVKFIRQFYYARRGTNTPLQNHIDLDNGVPRFQRRVKHEVLRYVAGENTERVFERQIARPL